MIILGFFVAIILTAGLGWTSGLNSLTIFDPFSVVFLIVIPAALALMNFGYSNLENAVRFLFGKNISKEAAQKALHPVKYISTTIVPIGVLAFLLGLIQILAHWPNDIAALAVAMAVNFIVIVYAVIFRYFLLIPWIMKLKAHVRKTG